MVDIRPFRGLRYSPALASSLSDLVCPPYDVISPAEQAELHAKSPLNVIRLELAEGRPEDSQGRDRYTRAARTLSQWRNDGTLVQDSRPSLYLHEVRFTEGGRPYERHEVLALVRLADWQERKVLPHEQTFSQPKADRLQLLRATAANVSPVFALYPGLSRAMENLWRHTLATPASSVFTDSDGSEHRFGICQKPELLEDVRLEAGTKPLFIADGHHRYETALHYRDERRQSNGSINSEAGYEWVLMALVTQDDPGLLTLPIHRLLKPKPPLHLEAVAASRFALERVTVDSAGLGWTAGLQERLAEAGRSGRTFGIYGPRLDQFTFATPLSEPSLPEELAPDRSQAWRDLDVAVVDQLLLRPLLAAARVELEGQVGYARDVKEACRAVQQGAAHLAVLMNPTRPDQVLAVAQAGDRMPEKSTYFYPKTPTGLVLYGLD